MTAGTLERRARRGQGGRRQQGGGGRALYQYTQTSVGIERSTRGRERKRERERERRVTSKYSPLPRMAAVAVWSTRSAASEKTQVPSSSRPVSRQVFIDASLPSLPVAIWLLWDDSF